MPLFKGMNNSWLESFMIKVLKCGPIPRHIAVILDGNRRYADKQGIPRSEGHRVGSGRFERMMKWCLDMGIPELSVYAFSIENFKRPEKEVKDLMCLFMKQVDAFLKEREDIEKNGICIRALGDLTLLPVLLQQTLAELVLTTRNNTRLYCNLCVCYTSREEMANAVREIAEGINKGLLIQSDITEELFKSCFYAPDSHEVDLLVRSSGELRLSDFLLWQSSDSVLLFAKANWPEFSTWSMFASIFYYQYCQRAKMALAQKQPTVQLFEGCNGPVFQASTSLQNCTFPLLDSHESFDGLAENTTEIAERMKRFLSYLQFKRLKQLREMAAGLTKQNEPYFDVTPSLCNKMQ